VLSDFIYVVLLLHLSSSKLPPHQTTCTDVGCLPCCGAEQAPTLMSGELQSEPLEVTLLLNTRTIEPRACLLEQLMEWYS
jgi:hypothetical protein